MSYKRIRALNNLVYASDCNYAKVLRIFKDFMLFVVWYCRRRVSWGKNLPNIVYFERRKRFWATIHWIFVVLKSGNEKTYMLILYYIPQSWVIENINQLEFAIFFRLNFFLSEIVKWKLGCKITNVPIFSNSIDYIY